MKPDPAPSTALTAPSAQTPSVWDDVRLQRLWLAAQRREWRSLAVIGAGPGVPTIEVAELLAQLAWRYRGEPSAVIDLRDLSLRLVDYHVREVRAQVDAGGRVLVALRSIFENPTAAPIAREVDAVVLCLRLGQTEFKAADQTVAEVGRDRILGSILVSGGARSTPAPNGAPRP